MLFSRWSFNDSNAKVTEPPIASCLTEAADTSDVKVLSAPCLWVTGTLQFWIQVPYCIKMTCFCAMWGKATSDLKTRWKREQGHTCAKMEHCAGAKLAKCWGLFPECGSRTLRPLDCWRWRSCSFGMLGTGDPVMERCVAVNLDPQLHRHDNKCCELMIVSGGVRTNIKIQTTLGRCLASSNIILC